MNEDAPATPADQTRNRSISRIVRRNSCLLILLLGAIGGILVGILNLVAERYHWTLQVYFFDIIDAPVNPLISPFYVRVGQTSFWAGWTSYTPNTSYGFRIVLATISYWTVIGLFVASLIYLVLNGVIRDIARDKICRWLLFFGSCSGMSIGCLSFLAASNGWDLDNCFNSLNQPVYSVMNVLRVRYEIVDSLLAATQKGVICWNTVTVIYWTIIGLHLALAFCVIRIGKKRKAARAIHVSEE